MYRGTTIDDIIRTVEQAEEQMQSAARSRWTEPEVEVYPLFSTYIYQWRGMEQMSAGAA